MIVEYDRLQMDIAVELLRISNFLTLETSVPTPHIKTRSLAKWQDELSEDEKRNILEAVSSFPVYHHFGQP